jgi:hypothetical protein
LLTRSHHSRCTPSIKCASVAARCARYPAVNGPAAPGEVMEIDSTPLDVMVLLDDGVAGRVELTGIIDVATRSVPAAVLRPSTRSVDASVLLARALTPEPMRPGWAEALKMAHSALPRQRLCSIDERLEHAAARPVIVSAAIVCDHGSVFISRNFRACRHLGINFQPARKATGSDKPHIERAFASVGSLFAQFVAGYTGSNPDRRGRPVADQPLWSMLELQELLDDQLIAFWQNRPHDGLRDPAHPGQAFSPNQMYAALIETAGYVPVALGAEDYIELLPTQWRAVNAYGIKIKRRSYDNDELNPLRQQALGRGRTPRAVGGPPRSLRRVTDLRARPARVDHRVLAAPGPGAGAVRGIWPGTTPAAPCARRAAPAPKNRSLTRSRRCCNAPATAPNNPNGRQRRCRNGTGVWSPAPRPPRHRNLLRPPIRGRRPRTDRTTSSPRCHLPARESRHPCPDHFRAAGARCANAIVISR